MLLISKEKATTKRVLSRETQVTILQQFISFASIGLIGTAGHYAMLVSLVQFVHLSPVIATTIGFVVGALINYVLNYHITFNSRKPHRETLTKFLLVAIAGAMLNTLIMMLGVSLLDLHYLIIQLFATGVVLLFNFLANRCWTFTEERGL